MNPETCAEMTALSALAPATASDSRAFRLRGGQRNPEHQVRHARRTLARLLRHAAPVLARHLDGQADRSADTACRDLQAGYRYLLFPDDLSPVVDDRPHRKVTNFAHYQPTRRPASRPIRGPRRAGLQVTSYR